MSRVESAHIAASRALVFFANLGIPQLSDEGIERLLRRRLLHHEIQHFLDAPPEIAASDRNLVRAERLSRNPGDLQPTVLDEFKALRRPTVNEFRAKLHRDIQAWRMNGEYASTDPIARFQHEHANARTRQHPGC